MWIARLSWLAKSNEGKKMIRYPIFTCGVLPLFFACVDESHKASRHATDAQSVECVCLPEPKTVSYDMMFQKEDGTECHFLWDAIWFDYEYHPSPPEHIWAVRVSENVFYVKDVPTGDDAESTLLKVKPIRGPVLYVPVNRVDRIEEVPLTARMEDLQTNRDYVVSYLESMRRCPMHRTVYLDWMKQGWIKDPYGLEVDKR